MQVMSQLQFKFSFELGHNLSFPHCGFVTTKDFVHFKFKNLSKFVKICQNLSNFEVCDSCIFVTI